MKVLFILSINLFHLACGPVGSAQDDSFLLITDKVDYIYRLNEPDERYYLPYVLEEVSGLSYLADGKLLCVEDEGGRLYEYDTKIKKISNAVSFYTSGDYEGVEYVDGQVYVLESDGDIYKFEYTDAEVIKAERLDTEFKRENDTEGLGYDPVTAQLLVACKDEEDVDDFKAEGKAVYALDKEAVKIKQLFLEISIDMIDDFYEKSRDQKFDKDKIKFEPSAVAINPVDGLVYILASVGKKLVVCNRSGEIMATYPISSRILPQPEGICFSPEGDMYISSEGSGAQGFILKYSMITK